MFTLLLPVKTEQSSLWKQFKRRKLLEHSNYLNNNPWRFIITTNQLHCNENSIYVFLFWELRGLNPNLYIHVSVGALYIPRIGPHISCSRIGKSMVGIYKSITDTLMWKLGLWSRNSFSGNICFQFLVWVLCSVEEFVISLLYLYLCTNFWCVTIFFRCSTFLQKFLLERD